MPVPRLRDCLDLETSPNKPGLLTCGGGDNDPPGLQGYLAFARNTIDRDSIRVCTSVYYKKFGHIAQVFTLVLQKILTSFNTGNPCLANLENITLPSQ
jgi:hypothetical protein